MLAAGTGEDGFARPVPMGDPMMLVYDEGRDRGLPSMICDKRSRSPPCPPSRTRWENSLWIVLPLVTLDGRSLVASVIDHTLLPDRARWETKTSHAQATPFTLFFLRERLSHCNRMQAVCEMIHIKFKSLGIEIALMRSLIYVTQLFRYLNFLNFSQ